MVTLPSAGDPNWDVPLNAALEDLQDQITTAESATTAVAARVTTLEGNGTWKPSDHNLVTWSFDPSHGSAGSSSTAGTLFLAAVHVRKDATVNNLLVGLVTAGATLTASQNWAGIYNSAGTLIGSTADQAATWVGAAGLKTMALSGGALGLTAGVYYVGLLANGTTPPQFLRANSQSSSMINVGLASGSGRYLSSGTGQTTLPASVNLSSAGTSNLAWWVGLS